MKNLFYFTVIMVFSMFTQCAPTTDESYSFVATLGSDTLVIEQFTISDRDIHAEIMIRSPRTRYIKHHMVMGDENELVGFESFTYDASDLDQPIIRQKLSIEGDSLKIITARDTTERISMIKNDPSTIPWIDMVHWPYELATRRMVRNNLDSVDQLMFTGRSLSVFELRAVGDDMVTIKHPSRGTMKATIDGTGAIQMHDATNTTRKLIVKKGGPLDIKGLTEYYSDKPIGSLSGAGSSESIVNGANIKLTFGQPAKRGRELFGGIVPWNQRWRTGANRATHITTDKDLKIGNLNVPAGEYTLFTIPAPDGGTLIINKQTGQNGRSYDEARDLGRVPMKIIKNSDTVELFTIDAVERAGNGVLQLKWGRTIFEVEFNVVM